MFLEFIEPHQKIACIGMSEFTNADDVQLCNAIGFIIASKNKILVSGNAKGADTSFAQGANTVNPRLVELYLPNMNHCKSHIFIGNKIYLQEDYPEFASIAKKHLDYYIHLTKYTASLFNRNAGIILNSDCVIALPNMQKAQWGGTGHSLRIAEAYNKPILNISEVDIRQEVKSLMKEIYA